MSRKLLLICAGGAFALATATLGAVAAPSNLGPAHPPGGDNSLQTLVRSGSGMHGGMGGMYSGHVMGGPRFYSHSYVNRGLARTRMAGRRHHHNRFFFAGYPYYYDDDYYYGYDSCWWSRPRHRWVCGYY